MDASADRHVLALVLGVAIAVALVVPVWVLAPTPAAGGGAPAPGTTTLGLLNGSTVDLEAGYLGVNVRANAGNITASSLASINATPVRTLRWPGGGLGDRLAILARGGAGSIYSDAGTATPANGSLANFAASCDEVRCRSIVTLPGEIDDPAYAAQVVTYSEVTLGFYPTYWEIGNEPAAWTHFGVAWANWTPSQDRAPTPLQYALVVQAYALAIHDVDPNAAIIGLPGVGRGGSSDAAWINATVTVNGPNLSAVAIHLYPAGSLTGPISLQSWFRSLSGATGLPARVEDAEAAIARACSSCSIALMVDEFGPATNVTAADGLPGGYLAGFLATLLAQGVSEPIGSLDYWALRSSTYGAWFDPQGVASASYDLYRALGEYLGTYAAAVDVLAPHPGVLALEGGDTASALTDVLVVNANLSRTAWVDLNVTYPAAAAGTAWSYTGSSTAPSVQPIGARGAENWTLPPGSVVIFSGLGARAPTTPVPTRASPGLADRAGVHAPQVGALDALPMAVRSAPAAACPAPRVAPPGGRLPSRPRPRARCNRA